MNSDEKTPFIGKCWPGDSYYADFINSSNVTPVWKQFFKDEEYFKNSMNIHTWIDMNEPSVFEGKENTMEGNLVHNDGEKSVLHKEIHNLFGQSYHKVTYECLKERFGERQRPFILSRSFYAGSQKYGFIWTGDNKATWDFMQVATDMLQSLSLCGYSAVGADVGGFDKNPTKELLMAWFEVFLFYQLRSVHFTLSTEDIL